MEPKEVNTSLLKSIFGAIPFVGNLLDEVAFEYRGRIKQKRLNDFTQLLSDYFEAHTPSSLENMKTEEFSDFLESLLKRVIQTGSSEKHKRFRDILISQIEFPKETINYAETYLDLVNSLDEIAIRILKYHKDINDNFEIKETNQRKAEGKLKLAQERLTRLLDGGQSGGTNELEHEINTLKAEIRIHGEEIADLQKFRTYKFYNITRNEFLYYKQILFSKGLLKDTGVGAIGVAPFQYMGITEFGQKFIEYIIT